MESIVACVLQYLECMNMSKGLCEANKACHKKYNLHREYYRAISHIYLFRIMHHYVNVTGRHSVESVLPACVSVEKANYAWANEGSTCGGQSWGSQHRQSKTNTKHH